LVGAIALVIAGLVFVSLAGQTDGNSFEVSWRNIL
jgi:hypothetical protein